MSIIEEIRMHLSTLAPHVANRKTAVLLRRAVDEIERVDAVIGEAKMMDAIDSDFRKGKPNASAN